MFRFYLTRYLNNSKGSDAKVSKSTIEEHAKKYYIAVTSLTQCLVGM